MPYLGLDRQVRPILLRGLDQKEPRQSGIDGTLDALQNFIAVKGADGGYEFMPRPGVQALTPTTVDSGSIVAGWRLATLGNQLVLMTGTQCYRRAVDGWHLVNATAPIIGSVTTPVISNSTQAAAVDTAYINGFQVTAALVQTTGTNTSDVVVTVTDSLGNTVITQNVYTSTVYSVRVIPCGTLALVMWQTTGNALRAVKFDSATPATLGSVTPIALTCAAQQPYDAQLVAATGTVAVIYLSTATSTYHLLKVTVSSLVVSSDTDTTIGGSSSLALAVNDWSTANLAVMFTLGGVGLSVWKFNATTFAFVSSSVYDATITYSTNITGTSVAGAVTAICTTSPNGTNTPTPSGLPQSDLRIVKSTGSAVTNVMRSLCLSSRALPTNGTIYVLASYRGPGQGTAFLLDVNAAQLVGRTLPDIAATTLPVAQDQLPSLALGANANTWITAARKILAVVSTQFTGSFAGPAPATLGSMTGAVTVTFTNKDTSVGRGVELNGGIHFPGSLPRLYDGGTLTEEGFPIAPEQSDTVVTATGGGSMTPGATYTIRACYAWPDAAGNMHRSPPTIVAQQFTMGATDNQATYSIPTLRATNKKNVIVEIYRTQANGDGSSYTMVTSPLAPLLNDPTVDRVSFLDVMSDITALQGQPLYTDGGIIDNLSPPPCKVFAKHRGRMLAGGIDGDPQAVWFSKDVIPGFGYAFNDGLVSRLNATSEVITALGSMDAYGVACTPTTAWATGDQYPDDTGLGGVLGFQQYSDTTGSALTGLLVRTDQGIMTWGGTKGAWRLSRGLTWDYAGSQIEDDAATFTPAGFVAVPGQNQIRMFGTRGGVSTVFTYETIFGTWGRWQYVAQATAIVDALVWNGAVAYLCADGSVMTENTALYDDLGVPVAHLALIGTLTMAGIGGYKRVLGANFTGHVFGTGGFTLNALQIIDNVVQPNKATTFGASDTVIKAELDPGPNGKCTEWAVQISDSGNGPNTAFSLVAVTLLVGLKKGLNKLPPANRMT